MHPKIRSTSIHRFNRFAFIVIASLFLLCALPHVLQRAPAAHAQSDVIHVDSASGQDTDICGTPDMPCKRIGYALENRAAAGDTLRVAQGVYVENLTVDKPVALEGGYEAGGWSRAIDQYETIIDGSNSRTVMGDWDGVGIHQSIVISDAGEYKMWYRGWDLTSNSFGLATSPDGVTWIKHANSPMLTPTEDWEDGDLGHPHVIKDGAIYKMWYAPNNRAVGYATSSDGINWTKYAENPILEGTPGAWDKDGISAPFVIKFGPNDYRMWYQDGNYAKIGYATSSDGINWTKHPDPVLTQGPRDAWDDERVSDPNILFDGVTYHMWYTGQDGSTLRIGYASSPDGINWTKSPNNPLLSSGTANEWDEFGVGEPNVLFNGAGYQMWFTGWKNDWQHPQRGYATSPDGLNWTKYVGNPVLTTGETGTWGKPVVYFASSSDGAAINGFTVRNGETKEGGGIYAASAEVTIESCKVVDNYAYDSGGGIRVSYAGAAAVISDTQVLNNEAGNSGGGITVRYDASFELRNSVIAHNRAKWDGGGIEIVESEVSIHSSELHANTVQGGAGGAIFISDQATVTVEGNRIRENSSEGWSAGGIFVAGGAQTEIIANEILSNTVPDNAGGGIRIADEGTYALIRGNIIRGNSAKGGGGINVSEKATAEISENEISENQASEWDGAGISVGQGADARILDNTFTGNFMSSGSDYGSAAIQILGSSTATVDGNTITNNGHIRPDSGTNQACLSIYYNEAPVVFSNNIVTGNECKGISVSGPANNITIVNNTISFNGSDGILVWGPIASVSLIRNNIVTNSAYGINAGDGGTIVRMDHNNAYGNDRSDYNYGAALFEANNISQDPRFVDPANGDYRLRFGSPSIDSGTVVDAPAHDVLGTARPQGSGLDMGAYEMSYPKIYLPSISTAASWTPR